jgi:hypothetical protein
MTPFCDLAQPILVFFLSNQSTADSASVTRLAMRVSILDGMSHRNDCPAERHLLSKRKSRAEQMLIQTSAMIDRCDSSPGCFSYAALQRARTHTGQISLTA